MIMGVGNILLTDEGFGVRAVEYLQAKYTWPENVRLEDGGTQGLLLMSTLMDCDTLVVLDVVLGPEKPGTIYMLEGEDLRKSLSFRDSMPILRPQPSRSRPANLPSASKKMKQPISRATLSSL